MASISDRASSKVSVLEQRQTLPIMATLVNGGQLPSSRWKIAFGPDAVLQASPRGAAPVGIELSVPLLSSFRCRAQ